MAYYTGQYVYAKSCTGGAQTGATGAMSWFLEAYKSLGGSNAGIYNCRPVRGGSGASLHSEGRALDLHVPTGAAWAQKLANALVNMSKELGLQIVIYNRRIWIGGEAQGTQGFSAYKGVNPHTDHLHIEMTWEMARKSATEVKKTWTDILAKASVAEPSKTENGSGEGVGSSGSDKKKSTAKDTSELVNGIPGEDELEGMSNYKKRLELEKQLSSSVEEKPNATIKDLTLVDQKKIANLGENVHSGKSPIDYANIGVSVIGFSVLLYTTLLFGLFLLDRNNTVMESKTLKTLSFGRLDVAYSKEDEGKDGSGTNYIGWGGILKYSLVGIVLGLILVSGVFFNMIEGSLNIIQSIFG